MGKSTVAVNLALALSALGKRVGILDGDIHGPSLPRMLGLEGKPESDDGKRILPKEKHGLRCMSIGLMTPPDAALVWRGPMIQSALMQLLGDVAWGELDVLLVDMPPGTGDIPLSLAQLAPLRGVVAVSTPQEVALGDVRRALNMFRRAEVAVLGVVENMACFVAPESGAKHYIFGKGGARRLAEEMELPFLGEIPLMERICEGGDSGLPVLLDAESAEAGPFMEVGRNLLAHLEAGEGEAPARP